MTARIEITNINEVLRGLDNTGDRIQEAVKYAIGMAGLAVERQAKLNASTGVHKRGTPRIPGSGPGPNVISGNLRKFIKAKVVGFGDSYAAEISSNMIYARVVEKGLPEWNGVKYPYLEPAAVRLSDNGTLRRVFIQHFAEKMRG